MSKDEFVERYHHVFGGMLLDAMTKRDGPGASMWMSGILAKVDEMLTKAYYSALSIPDPRPAPTPPPNGLTANGTPAVGKTKGPTMGVRQ